MSTREALLACRTFAKSSSLVMCWCATSASPLSSMAAYNGCAAAKAPCSSAALAMAAYASTREAVHMTDVPLHCHFSCSNPSWQITHSLVEEQDRSLCRCTSTTALQVPVCH